MKRDNLPWRCVQPATLAWTESGEPVSHSFGDVYFSRGNGLEESRHVFLQGNNLPQRWLNHPGKHFCIAETGFGTGLNFLLTWQAWQGLPEPRPDLHYLAIDKHPLTSLDLQRAHAAWPSLQVLAKSLLNAYPGLLPGQHRVMLEAGRVRLDLWWEDAEQALLDLAGWQEPLVHAWYLDGFSPARNTAMWTPNLFRAAATLSRPGATLATFTVAGEVRRNLDAAGFQVDKVPGYGQKRECLRSVLKESNVQAPHNNHLSTWDTPACAQDRPDSVLIIGAGLAGCSVAAALARRGIAVTLLEQRGVACAGSGNDQGILYTRLSRRHSALTDFALQSFRFAATFYGELFASGRLVSPVDGNLCGSFQQSDDASEMAILREGLTGVEELAQVLNARQASNKLGVDQPSAGYWYPGSGWLRPVSVCEALLDHSNIQVIENCGTVSLRSQGGAWQALSGEKILAQAPCAIAATGTSVTTTPQCDWLPVQAIRGQVTRIPTAPAFAALQAALCHEGYIAPARAGYHSIGATFDSSEDSADPRADDNRYNLDKLATAVPAWRDSLQALDPTALQARVGFRCASPDYLPIVGPVPDMSGFLQDFGPLRNNAKQKITRRGSYAPGLYVNTAHGSRGLTSTPIAAELLASMICAEPPPFSRTLCRALAPARFIIRELSRNRM